MINKTTRVVAEWHPWSGNVALYIVAGRRPGPISIARKIVMEEAEEGDALVPVLQIGREEAQELMDSLWLSGVRPSDHRHTAETIAAKDAHIEDMRYVIKQLIDLNFSARKEAEAMRRSNEPD